MSNFPSNQRKHLVPTGTMIVKSNAAAALALCLGLCASGAMAATKTWTTTADFQAGTAVGATAIDGKLVLSITGSTFPVLWIANAGEDSLTKFDTRSNKELARYRTWFGPFGQAGHYNHLGSAYDGAAPSRTSVDIEGNAYVLNRHFDGRSASLLKVLSNSFIDRNGNGQVDSSVDTNGDGIISASEMLPMADTNGNGIIDASEIKDERVAWAARVPDGIKAPARTGRLGRSMCIAPDGNLWVGLYSDNSYYKVSAADGSTMAGPFNVGATPYGCLVDNAGKLWSATLDNQMARLDTVAGVASSPLNMGDSNYGIALDNNAVYLASLSGNTYVRYDKGTGAITRPAAVKFTSLSLSIDGTGALVTGGTGGSDGVHRFNPTTGALLCSNTGQGLSDARGVIADADDNVWVISLSSNRISKYDKNCNKLGTFPVGNSPYTYSDAAGLAARSITTRSGDWNVVYDSTVQGTTWGQVQWNGNAPAGGTLAFSVRAADSLVLLGGQTYTDVGNGSQFRKNGRFIEVKARLAAGTDGTSPTLNDVTVSSAVCDVNNDLLINNVDINLITAARGSAVAAGDVRDADSDGKITVLDARKCALKCTNGNCGTAAPL